MRSDSCDASSQSQRGDSSHASGVGVNRCVPTNNGIDPPSRTIEEGLFVNTFDCGGATSPAATPAGEMDLDVMMNR